MERAIRKLIQEQLKKLFESFDMDNEGKSYVPTTEVSKVAQIALQALNKISQNGARVSSLDDTGNEGSGKLKAKQLASKKSQSFAEMKRLKSFFDSNAAKVDAERKNIGIIQQRHSTIDEMTKSNILLVWNLHGGDVCKKWVDSKLSNAHEQGNKKKERLRKAGGADKNNGMGVFKTQFDPSQQRIKR